MKWIQWFQAPKLDNNRLIHSLKTAIAFLFGVFIVRLFHFPQNGLWVLISILVVMCAQSRVGAIIQKSYMRFLGTVLGASIAAFTLWLAYPSVIWTTLILCLTTALFSYIADSPSYLSEAGPLGAVTAVIVLIGQNPSYVSVLSRFFEISLGIVIALLVSRFIWPLHSRTQLRYIVLNTLQNLKEISGQLKAFYSVEAEKNYEVYEDKVISRFSSQSKLLNEVMRESFGRSSLAHVFRAILRSEREILRWISLMKNALMSFSEEMRLKINQQTRVQRIYEQSQQLFESLIKQLNDKESEYPITTLNSILNWKNEVHKELSPFIKNDSDELAIDLFIFASGNLLNQLTETNTLIKKI